PGGIVDKAGVEITRADPYATQRKGIFACGDMRRGQSLVVWAIREGRECADAVEAWLRTHETGQDAGHYFHGVNPAVGA
ncbi:MAG: hypothetical protein ACXWU1_07350, partial [Allosphingosinicella sp.]